MSKIEKPWVAFGATEKTQCGLITEDRKDISVAYIMDSEKIGQSTSWNYEYIERFEDPNRLSSYLFGKIDKIQYQVVDDLREKFPTEFKTIDKLGCYLTTPYPVLDVCEWEDMQTSGEIAWLESFKDIEEARKKIEKLCGIVCRFSTEIFRLRLTYGEEVWSSVYHSKEEDDLIRKTHEAERH